MKSLLLAALAAVAFALPAHAAPIRILAAENFYGEAAQAIGANRVAVESVIVAPGTDPHDYEPTPSVARKVADAEIVVMNGAGYDPWMARLVDANHVAGRVVIDVAALSGHKAGDNPHVWYDPKAMPAMANALTAELVKLDPAGKERLRAAARRVPRHAGADRRAGGGTEAEIRRNAGGGDRAGVRLHG